MKKFQSLPKSDQEYISTTGILVTEAELTALGFGADYPSDALFLVREEHTEENELYYVAQPMDSANIASIADAEEIPDFQMADFHRLYDNHQ